jgi:hypothetical protein
MQTREEFIRRIVSRSGIMTSKGRRELERELNAHLEDAIAEARSEGCDEATILQTIWARFGDPDEIANDFAMVHRFERRAISIAHSLALMAVSMLTVTGLISVFQLLVANLLLGPSSRGISALTRRDHRVRIPYTWLYRTPSGRAFVSKAAIDEGLCTELHPVRVGKAPHINFINYSPAPPIAGREFLEPFIWRSRRQLEAGRFSHTRPTRNPTRLGTRRGN